MRNWVDSLCSGFRLVGLQRVLVVPQHHSLLIGRHVTTAWTSPMFVSRHHARLFIAGGRVHVEDLNSLNGTRVNGKRVQGAVAVQPGDTLDFGFQGPFDLITLLQFPWAGGPAIQVRKGFRSCLETQISINQ